MSDCVVCGKKLGMFVNPLDGLCNDCWRKGMTLELAQELQAKQQEEEQRLKAAIDAIILTTETNSDLKIIERKEIITAECAFGMNIFKDLFADVRDIVGGRSKAVQNTLRDARRTTLYELKKEAYEVGANAVVGVDLDYVELSASGSMVLLVASGTAVVVADQQRE